jgi:hypothetical protein
MADGYESDSRVPIRYNRVMSRIKAPLVIALCAGLLVPLSRARADEAEPDAVAPAPAPEEDPGLVKPIRRRRPAEARPDAPTTSPTTAASAKRPQEGQYGSRRIQVFVIPVGDSAAVLAAGPAQLGLESEVAKMPGYHPVDLVQELASALPPAALAKLEEARRTIKDGNEQMESHQYAEAANRYQRAIDLMEDAMPATEAAEYAAAFVRLGLARQFSGEDDAAKHSFVSAARIDLAKAVDGRTIDKDLGNALDRAREGLASGPVGSLSVVTNPPGSRVFVGGAFRGTSPVTVDRLPAGLNFVKVDRPGAYPITQLVEVKEARDLPVRIQMHFTDETQQLQLTLSQVPDSIDHEKGVPDMVKAVGKRFRLERAVISTVRMARTNVAEVRVCVFDLPRGARLADERAVFALDSETGFDADVATWARGVFDRADKSRDRGAKDPLTRGDGTEDWYNTEHSREREGKGQTAAAADPNDPNTPEWERSNYKPTQTKKKGKGSKDPLDHKDGTEEW